MLLWIICAALAIVVGLMVTAPFWRPVAAQGENPDVVFYRAQLDELEKDRARGLITNEEADRSRTEIARRLIAADQSAPHDMQAKPAKLLGVATVVAIAIGGVATYAYLGAPGYGDLPLTARLAAADDMRANRPSQAAMVAVAPALPQVETTQDYRDSIAQLRAIVPTRGNDVEGWSLLAFHEGQLRNFDAAAKAQAQVIALKGGAAEKSDTYRLLDLMVAAAGGFVSPEAEAQARALYDADSTDHVARYYIGALFNQTDRPDLALRMWRPIVETGDPTTYHVNSAREQIEDAALRAGVRYTLPAPRGPTATDIANASDLSAEDRTAMVRSMVASLSNRLATEGGSADEWARLITAYGVLGETTAASKVWLEAKEVFATSNAAMDILRTAATGAGVGP